MIAARRLAEPLDLAALPAANEPARPAPRGRVYRVVDRTAGDTPEGRGILVSFLRWIAEAPPPSA